EAPRQPFERRVVAGDELGERGLVAVAQGVDQGDVGVCRGDRSCSWAGRVYERDGDHTAVIGSGSGCVAGLSNAGPTSGKISTDNSPAPIRAAPSAALRRSSSWPIAVAATMNGSDVACISPAEIVWRPLISPR